MSMNLGVSRDHPTFTLKKKIQEVSENFLQTFGFSYFQYLRCYADGSIGLLSNDTRLFEYFQEVDNAPVAYSSFENEHEKAHSYWFLWDEDLPSEPVQLVREKFNLHNGLTLVRRSKNYYDMIAVALPQDHSQAAGFYLNKLKAIEDFINTFDIDNKDLIGIMDKTRIAVPEPYRDVNYKKMCLSKGKIAVMGKYGETHLTSQELACLRLLALGASYKKIAQMLELSSRTIEVYINRIKERTGFNSSIELERMLLLAAAI